jgi:hypothetical protein
MNRVTQLILTLAGLSLAALLMVLTVGAQARSWADDYPIQVPDDYPTIQAAIDAAAEGDEIWVAKGLYTENLSINKGIALYGGWNSSFTLQSPGDTTIDGNKTGRTISITCASSDTVVTIDGFAIQNGDATGLGTPETPELPASADLSFRPETLPARRAADPASPSEQAAELRARLADLLARGLYPGGPVAYQAMLGRLERRTAQAERARARSNSSSAPHLDRPAQGVGIGGGVYSYNASLHLLDCYLHSNVANQNGVGIGGGIYVGNAPPSGIQIVHNHVDSNVASNNGHGLGGGLYLFEAPAAVLTLNWFDHNVASAYGKGLGGGLFVHGSPGASIAGDEFLGNAASYCGDGLGGGVYVYQAPGVIVEDSIFFENIASDGGAMIKGLGGGLMVDSSPGAVVRGNEIERNTANGAWQYGTGAGGGLFLAASDGAAVSDNAFRGNLAALHGMGEGGGLTLYQTQNTQLADNEVSGNWAAMYQEPMLGVGGGIAMDSVYSTTLSGNDIRANTAAVYEEGLASGGGLAGSGLNGQTRLVGNNIAGNVACYTGSGYGGGVGVDGAQDVVVTDNTVTDNVASLQLGRDGAGGGMYLADTASSQVLGNRFQGNRAGDAMDSQGGGLMITNYESDDRLATVDANLFLDNRPGGCDLAGMAKASFTNNVVAKNKTPLTGGLGLDSVQDGAVVNNTVIDNGHHGITAGGLNTTLSLVNNIVVSHTVGLVVQERVTATVRYTLWRGNGAGITGSGVVSHTHPVTGSPAFADAASRDYHLTSGSAARDAGDPAGVPPAPNYDADGVARPQGPAVDLGAYEWRGYLRYLPLVARKGR